MKIDIAKSCQKCRFKAFQAYTWYRCTIYDRLMQRDNLFKRPNWCNIDYVIGYKKKARKRKAKKK